jgi:hypothetical protein
MPCALSATLKKKKKKEEAEFKHVNFQLIDDISSSAPSVT